MSAAVLREAAALMRSRAESANKPHPGPWKPMGSKSVAYSMTPRMFGTVAETYPLGGSADQVATTAHIASWHPAVALAVADWLDAEANEIPPHATHYRDGLIDDAPAVRVARAYLGDPS